MCSHHMRKFIDPQELNTVINYAVEALKSYSFDGIAFQGMSGAFIGPPVALRLNKSMLLVRKDGDTTHSAHKVEGDKTVRKYVILDDFISTGDTLTNIKNHVKKFQPRAKCIGVLEVTMISLEGLSHHPYQLSYLDESGNRERGSC